MLAKQKCKKFLLAALVNLVPAFQWACEKSGSRKLESSRSSGTNSDLGPSPQAGASTSPKPTEGQPYYEDATLSEQEKCTRATEKLQAILEAAKKAEQKPCQADLDCSIINIDPCNTPYVGQVEHIDAMREEVSIHLGSAKEYCPEASCPKLSSFRTTICDPSAKTCQIVNSPNE